MDARTLQLVASDPAEFRKHLLIDADGSIVPFAPDPWQTADFVALDDGWRLAAGRYTAPARGLLSRTLDAVTGRQTPCRRGWFERPRGHSKTSDIAVMACWALLFAVRPIRGIAAAADKDQAGLLRDAIATLVRCNPWMKSALDVQAHAVINTKTKAQLDIIASDVATSFGQLPDIVVCDEISHWPEGKGEQLWGSLFSSSAKRSNCLLIAISNAGFTGSWVWRVREAVRYDPAWHFSHLDRPQATWITADRLEEQRRLLPPLVYSRLWENEWTSGTGDALTEADICAAIKPDLEPMGLREEGYFYAAGLDLGISRDHASLIVVARHFLTRRIRLAYCKRWIPPRAGKIDLIDVQESVVAVYERFRPVLNVDPYQAELLVQLLSKRGVYCQMIPFVGTALSEMASGVIETFQDHSIDLYEDAGLLADLRRLRLKESASGWKLDSVRTAAGGHADAATALALAILAARRCPAAGGPSVPDPEELFAARRQESSRPDARTRGLYGLVRDWRPDDDP